jgi:hypothetical protein
LQSELDTTATVRPIRILGINAAGLESGNAAICAGRTLPWLQDTSGAGVWQAWAANIDDVILLDSANMTIGVYNLQAHTLANSTNFAQLKAMLLAAAQ